MLFFCTSLSTCILELVPCLVYDEYVFDSEKYQIMEENYYEKKGLAIVMAENMVELNETNFPDDVFRQYLKYTFDTDGDGWIDSDGVEDIDLSSFTENADKKAQSLQGIEKFSNLRLLLCGNNNLITLDVSNNTKLIQLWCRYNNISALDLIKNTALGYLYCSYNKLRTLDLRNSQDLMVVDCSNNYIHNVDFSYLGYGVVKKGSQYPIEELEAKDGRYYYTRHGDADTSVTKLFKWSNI